MVRIVQRFCVVSVIALLLGGAALAATTPRPAAPKKFTVTLAYFTATPKPLKPGQVRSTNLAIIPEDGASFALDVSTPVRFRRQMESVSKDYDYSLDLAGSVVCETGTEKQTELRILPDPKDPDRLQMTGLVWVSQIQPHLVKLMLTSIRAFVTKPGAKAPVQVFGLNSTKTAALGRTYVAGYQAASKAKDAPISLLAVCVTPGG